MPTEHGARTHIASSGPVNLPAADAGIDSPITELIAAIEAEQAHAEKPSERREARAPAPAREAVQPPVPHRTVQQLPEPPRQARGSAHGVGSNPLAALIAEIDRGAAQSSRGIR